MAKPQVIGKIIPSVLKKMGLAQKVKQIEIVDNWGEIVGETVAKHCKPVSLDKACLIVNVDSSPWLNELKRYSRETILEKLQSEFGKNIISNIKFRIGTVNNI